MHNPLNFQRNELKQKSRSYGCGSYSAAVEKIRNRKNCSLFSRDENVMFFIVDIFVTLNYRSKHSFLY